MDDTDHDLESPMALLHQFQRDGARVRVLGYDYRLSWVNRTDDCDSAAVSRAEAV